MEEAVRPVPWLAGLEQSQGEGVQHHTAGLVEQGPSAQYTVVVQRCGDQADPVLLRVVCHYARRWQGKTGPARGGVGQGEPLHPILLSVDGHLLTQAGGGQHHGGAWGQQFGRQGLVARTFVCEHHVDADGACRR